MIMSYFFSILTILLKPDSVKLLTVFLPTLPSVDKNFKGSKYIHLLLYVSSVPWPVVILSSSFT